MYWKKTNLDKMYTSRTTLGQVHETIFFKMNVSCQYVWTNWVNNNDYCMKDTVCYIKYIPWRDAQTLLCLWCILNMPFSSHELNDATMTPKFSQILCIRNICMSTYLSFLKLTFTYTRYETVINNISIWINNELDKKLPYLTPISNG